MNILRFEDFINEKKKACWKGYKQVGFKTKDGKKVPNCVPDEEGKIPEQKPQKKSKS